MYNIGLVYLSIYTLIMHLHMFLIRHDSFQNTPSISMDTTFQSSKNTSRRFCSNSMRGVIFLLVLLSCMRPSTSSLTINVPSIFILRNSRLLNIFILFIFILYELNAVSFETERISRFKFPPRGLSAVIISIVCGPDHHHSLKMRHEISNFYHIHYFFNLLFWSLKTEIPKRREDPS